MRINGNVSPEWLDAQYNLWQENPSQVAPDWRAFFEGFELARQAPSTDRELAAKESAVDSLIYRYRDLGHLLACTDPLSPCKSEHPLFSLEAFGLSEKDLDRTFYPLRFPKHVATLREIIALLKDTYCRTIGVEFMHIQDPAQRHWLKDRMETVRNQPKPTREDQIEILKTLQRATLFEAFLHKKFLGQKRFSLEGGEAMVPLLECLVAHAAQHSVSDMIMGMAHRGRLNVLANIFQKPLENIFAEFKDNLELAFVGDGDVKYHKGCSAERTVAGHKLHLSLVANPSHLEAVNPVVLGKCRARHAGYGPGGRKRVLPVLIHGDAAFAGQGTVAEVLNLSQIDGYQSGGTFHLVLNNQIGFTTEPVHARSTLYATDIAKMLMVPIFHVNGEDPEAVVWTTQMALDYRQKFARDVVVEVICYRRHGHNEGDEPFFTQPLMYEKIRQRPPLHKVYAQTLIDQGVDPKQIAALEEQTTASLESALDTPQTEQKDIGYRDKWSHVRRDYRPEVPETAVPAERLKDLSTRLVDIPESFQVHRKIAALLRKRHDAVTSGEGIDWANAEALAFASLLVEQVPVRLSGQDSRRGTFNQRHAAVVDQKNGQLYFPLAFLERGQAAIQIYNSILSEAAVLGFEYGYSLETPEGLCIWEAQFGDFANGAQVIIDQFISGSGTKWDRSSGLVLYLPHGYEGQGPEHSSARIERFLSLCANHNMQVAYPSTPAQLFHLLRRQIKVSWRRPLVIFTPKSLLRLPACTSTLQELSEGTFHNILPCPAAKEDVRILLLCTGKIYYELLEAKQDKKRQDVGLLRIEQIYPFDSNQLLDTLAGYPNAKQLIWVQEEPANMGAWPFLRSELQKALGQEPRYIGRKAAAATAVGSHRRHQQEQQELIESAFVSKE
ncbi:MAG: 2-oxoglutarate dehydrogenase E1 component [Deltaproteobacteria bacterium]|jgi:2-oxoglutarate dehydrogenase E1 component|nr:2-oxoglutarate dehydrogenase E1 component [Deltaproteobacteria bacterium]